MKLGIAWRFGIALALVGVLASGLTGYYGYIESRSMLVSAAETRLLTATRVLGRQLSVGLEDTSRDALLIAQHPQAANLLAMTDSALAASGENAAQLFLHMLQTHPEYFQVRLIDTTRHGLERIRVDRSEGGAIRVLGDELQEKAHFPYVFETCLLPPGSVYVSNAMINREIGAHAGLGRPALQVAAPVYAPDRPERAVGVVVINVDLGGLFAQLAADLPGDVQLYLTNSNGDFLIHPDPKQAFAFEHGQQALVQDEFPDTRTLTAGSATAAQLVTTTTPVTGPAMVAAFVRQPVPGLRLEDEFILGLSQPLARVLADSDRLGAVSLRIVLGFSAAALLIAFLLARALTRPLHQIVNAVRHFPRENDAPLPCARHDEIGLLARSIDQMQQQIGDHLGKLEQKQQALDHLASHDSLTGLPNRRLFLDRLDHALARARRLGGQLTLLFIDLDNFKNINDQLGHAAGDAVLTAAAGRLQQLVRETDTVARLGGDEFIILLDGVGDSGVIQYITHGALEALSGPVEFEGHMLKTGGSVGIARYPADGAYATRLIAAADEAMYRAKAAGRNRAQFADQTAN